MSNMDATLRGSRGRRWLILVGSIGPLGFAPASGTVTVAVVGIPLFLLLSRLPVAAYVAVTVVFTLAAVAVHAAGDRVLGEKDSRKLVWDEIAGYLIAMAAVPATWQLVVFGFFAERFIDILKIPPANVIEQRVPGGWGVVGDDVIAGLWTLGLCHLLIWLVPGWVGLGG
jgi:phosphatidylglycerophosphatase A